MVGHSHHLATHYDVPLPALHLPIHRANTCLHRQPRASYLSTFQHTPRVIRENFDLLLHGKYHLDHVGIRNASVLVPHRRMAARSTVLSDATFLAARYPPLYAYGSVCNYLCGTIIVLIYFHRSLRLVMPPTLFAALQAPFTKLAHTIFPVAVANGIISGAFLFCESYTVIYYAWSSTMTYTGASRRAV